MLWTVTKPENSGLYWLDDVYQNFYKQLFEGVDFDDCFLDDFNDVLDNSQKTNEKFEAVFEQYNLLDEPFKEKVKSIYASHIVYKECFSSIENNIEIPCENVKYFWEKAKSLATYLYSTTIGLVCFKNACADDADMDAHYQEYKDLNGIVCCFCGTEEMMEERDIEPEDGFEFETEKQWRASYDHYLPKKLYPFLAVDFDNLIPCCQKCNEKAKGEIDVLSADEVRTLSFYPYDDEDTVQLEASLIQMNEKVTMSVNIKDLNSEVNAKADTWNRAFKVIPRVNKRIRSFKGSWLAPLFNGIDAVERGKSVLESEIRRCKASQKQEREAFFKALCFGEVLSKSDDELRVLLDSISSFYSSRTGL